jgi:hypothetical protein
MQTGTESPEEKLTLDLLHSKDHRAEIRDQPDSPYDHAVLMETVDQARILPQQDHRCPNGMDQHQDDGQRSGNAMQVKRQPPGHFKHHPRSPSVTDETEPEEDQVPGFQFTRDSLAPNAYAVENESKGDHDR